MPTAINLQVREEAMRYLESVFSRILLSPQQRLRWSVHKRHRHGPSDLGKRIGAAQMFGLWAISRYH